MSTTHQLVVVGDPIEHSLSPLIHEAFAQQLGHSIQYTKQRVTAEGFAGYFRDFFAQGGMGANVTVPLKTLAWQLTDELDDLARDAGAVNTLKLEQGRVLGFNTDGLGIVADIVDRHGWGLANSSVLICGAGGATQGVMGPLIAAGVMQLHVVNRTPEKALDLVAKFQGRSANVSASGFDALEELGWRPDIIINATSTGLSGQALPLPLSWISHARCYDMSYGAQAKFAVLGRLNGAVASVDGLGMLVEQAADAYQIWLGVRPTTQPVYARLRQLVDRPSN